ncbi:MAG: serine hydrolase [Prochlorotrichaceae cyanobacterium]
MPFTPLSPFPEPPESSSTEPTSGMAQSPKPVAINLPSFGTSQDQGVSPRPNPFAPRPVSPHPSPPNLPFSGRTPSQLGISAPPPLRKRQNPVHSTPKLRSATSWNPSSRRKFTHPDSTSFSPMTTLSRSSRNTRRRSSRSDRQNRFQVVPSSGSSTAAETGAETSLRESSKPKGRSRSKRLPLPVLFGIRLLILGVGLGVIAGTLLAALDPNYQLAAETTEGKTNEADSAANPGNKLLPVLAKNPLALKSNLGDLTQQLEKLAAQQPDLVVGAFLVDLDTGNYAHLNGERSFATASMIKVPVLVAFFQDVDAGKIDLTEKLTMREDLVAPHAGDMQYLPVGTQFTALETAEEMIRISDNTATNMLIDRLGGIEALNKRFQQWGLQHTVLNEWLPDLEGTNISTPKDLVTLMSLVEQGHLVSLRSRDRLLAIMRTPVTNTLLPQGLGEGATIAHKTGDIGTLVGDVGLIDMPNGKRYLATMMVERPFNDNRAQELIRQMARASYDYLEKLPVVEPRPGAESPSSILTQQGQVISPASLPVGTPR